MCLPLLHIVHKNHRHYTIVHHLLLLSVVFFIRHRRHRRRTTTTTYSHLFFSFCAVIRSRIQATYVRSHANFVSSCWWFFFSSSSFVCLLLLTAVVLWLGNQFRSGAVRPSCSEDEKKRRRGARTLFALLFVFLFRRSTDWAKHYSFVCLCFFSLEFSFRRTRASHVCRAMSYVNDAYLFVVLFCVLLFGLFIVNNFWSHLCQWFSVLFARPTFWITSSSCICILRRRANLEKNANFFWANSLQSNGRMDAVK